MPPLASIWQGATWVSMPVVLPGVMLVPTLAVVKALPWIAAAILIAVMAWTNPTKFDHYDAITQLGPSPFYTESLVIATAGYDILQNNEDVIRASGFTHYLCQSTAIISYFPL